MKTLDVASRKMRFCGRMIYDKNKGLIFCKKPVELLKLSLFILAFYVIIAAVFVAQLFFIQSVYIGNLSTDGVPASSDILAVKPGVFVAAGSRDSFSAYKCSRADNNKMIQEVTTLLRHYTVANTNLPCDQTYTEKSENKKCGMNVALLGRKCKTSPYGLGTKNFCVYIRLAKIGKFNPPGLTSNNYINIECKQKNVAVKTSPQGFLRNMLPYKGKNDLQPLVAIEVNAVHDSPVRCILKAKGVVVSDSFSPSTAAGVIEIPVKLGPSHGC